MYLLNYELRGSKQSTNAEFVKQAKARGWHTRTLGKITNEWYHLPPSTLIGTCATMDIAKASLAQIQAATQAALKRKVFVTKWFIAEYSGASFASDVKEPGPKRSPT